MIRLPGDKLLNNLKGKKKAKENQKKNHLSMILVNSSTRDW